MRDQFRSDEGITRVTVPLLIMHGTNDPAIPIVFGERLFALAREPKQLMRFPGGDTKISMISGPWRPRGNSSMVPEG